MHAVFAAAVDTAAAPDCVVMLPAAFCAAEDFVREGFVSAARTRSLPLDLVFVQPAARHVTDRSVLERLHEEIILPARGRGSRAWLGGISLGGYLALGYAARHADQLTGLCLLAPYVGSHLVTGEIARAGGVQQWQPAQCNDADDEERRLWCFVKSYDRRRLQMHLGMGSDDRFADRHRVLAQALAPADVESVPGGHDWPTWHRLWENFLARRFTPHE